MSIQKAIETMKDDFRKDYGLTTFRVMWYSTEMGKIHSNNQADALGLAKLFYGDDVTLEAVAN